MKSKYTVGYVNAAKYAHVYAFYYRKDEKAYILNTAFNGKCKIVYFFG